MVIIIMGIITTMVIITMGITTIGIITIGIIVITTMVITTTMGIIITTADNRISLRPRPVLAAGALW